MRVGRTYVYERDSRKNNIATYSILSLIAAGVGIYTLYESISLFGAYRDTRSSFASLIVHPSGYESQFDPAHNGDVVHVNLRQQDLIFEREAYDPYLNLKVPNAVILDRNVEYCQWQEHVHERTEKTGEHSERVVRTYTYTKGWRSYLINSMFFDQPAAHHNPMRNPVLAGPIDSVGISSVKGFKISAPAMKNLRGSSSIVNFGQESLKDTLTSPGVVNDKFFYTGNNGWFLSKYTPSTAESLMKAAFQYAEGTLLDFQLGDLFSVCDAGDIRVRLEGKVLTNGISVIAEQMSDGSLVPFKSLKGRNIMLIESGQVSAEEMRDNELNSQFWTLFWYIIGFLVSAALCALFVMLLLPELKDNKSKNN